MSIKGFIRQALDMNRRDLLEIVRELSGEELAWKPAPHANSIGFLLWHMARVEDGWIQRPVQRIPHLWVSENWHEKFGMPEDQRDMGYGYTQEQIESQRPAPLKLLLDYGEAVRNATIAFIDSWDPETDDRQVKAAWGMISVTDVFQILIWELNQHGGQAGYIKGLRKGLLRPDYMGPLSLTQPLV